MWELGEALRVLPPERLILAVPFGKAGYERYRQVAEEALRAQANCRQCEEKRGPLNPPALPRYVGGRPFPARIKALIYFTPGWKAEFVPLERPPRFEEKLMGALDRGLWPAVLQLTDYESRSRNA